MGKYHNLTHNYKEKSFYKEDTFERKEFNHLLHRLITK